MKFNIKYLNPFGVLIEAKQRNIDINQIDIQMLKNLFHQNQLIVLRGFTTFKNSEEYSNYCENWGKISIWPFGKVLELIEEKNAKDHIFDHNYVPLHWDGMYRPCVPEYQIFHCVDSPNQNDGGETVFSNTLLALQKLKSNLIEKWKNTLVRYSRKMEFYDSVTVSPLITKHPYKDVFVIRYNEPPHQSNLNFVNPPDIEFLDVENDEREDLQFKLNKILYSIDTFYAHVWQKNDVVIADNFTLLHGRNSYTSGTPRHLQRVHVDSSPAFTNPGLQEYK